MNLKDTLVSEKADFNIECVVVTPLTQIDPSDEKDSLVSSASMIKTKSRKVLRDNGRFESVPFYSANALRSICRSIITEDIHAKLNESGRFNYTLPDFQAYTTGGGSNADSVTAKMTFAIERRMREASPFFSIFGIGLGGIEGKSSFLSLTPPEGAFGVGATYGVRMDRTRDGKSMLLIDEASVLEWMEEQSANSKNNKEYRATDAEVEKCKKALNAARKSGADTAEAESALKVAEAKLADLAKGVASFQQMYKFEYIIPGTKLYAGVSAKAGYCFSDIEKGMMLRALIGTSKRQLGSMKAQGHGILDWKVVDKDGETLFTMIADKSYHFDRELVISDNGYKVLAPYEQWLNSLEASSVSISDIYATATIATPIDKKVDKIEDEPGLFG